MDFSHEGKELGPTGVIKKRLIEIGKASVDIPIGTFNLHERLSRTHVGARLKAIEKNEIDWSTAEAMAFGSLL